MEIHVLGFWGTYPGPGEATTGFLLQTDEGRQVLLDCGSGVLAQLFKITSVHALDAVIVTHHHFDHAADLGVLQYALLLARLRGERTRPLEIYMPHGPAELERAFHNEPLANLQRLDASSRLEIAGLQASFARTEHPVECLAVRLEGNGKVFAFSADSALSPVLEQVAQGADLFVCEASMYDGQEEEARQAGHVTARQAGEVAKRAGAKRLAITHYPHYGDLNVLQRQASEGFGRPVERLHTLQRLTV
ncbi:MAG: MBL fold metallo-hydrolase [Alicyclobacillus macrosporangiidus]|uniref:MBL fold metallo-hydrolase n=1 Tax=Alicyclobacillus macrosporangiidus TaxID=392015 RepID=UPI0026ED4926|nr:MBL fold metallo-hydrolase [Alicyclobacillus macrosporangiidus]MCL6598870.1 MBL fold metallo-hydrolase [Alicyclobacillus macrosporangiidus]